MRLLIPKTIPLMVLGTGVLRCWVLGPFGLDSALTWTPTVQSLDIVDHCTAQADDVELLVAFGYGIWTINPVKCDLVLKAPADGGGPSISLRVQVPIPRGRWVAI